MDPKISNDSVKTKADQSLWPQEHAYHVIDLLMDRNLVKNTDIKRTKFSEYFHHLLIFFVALTLQKRVGNNKNMWKVNKTKGTLVHERERLTLLLVCFEYTF